MEVRSGWKHPRAKEHAFILACRMSRNDLNKINQKPQDHESKLCRSIAGGR
jgi:hypothetical protein